MTVDVLLPTYNPDRELLRVAIRSLQAQTYPHWQLFIHHDPSDAELASGGEPAVSAVVKEFLNDERITFQKSPKRLGIGANWNACFKATKNPIVAYLFQDDFWAPEYLERAVKVLEENDAVGLVSMHHDYKIEGEIVTENEYVELNAWKKKNLSEGIHPGKEFLKEWISKGLRPNVIGEPCFVVMRRYLMEEVGPFNEEMPQSLDVEYWVRMIRITDWYYEPNVSGFFRVHPQAATAHNRREGKGLFDRVKILEMLIGQLPAGEMRTLAARSRRRQIGRVIARMTKFVILHPIETIKTVVRNVI
jgi:glycosyltransferase involved in cell wall biosynthesis